MREVVEPVPGVFVATSRTMTTTSTVVTAGGQALLVDPAWHPDELAGLAQWLRSRRLAVVGGLASHAHHDHLLWHPDFGGATRWASPTTARLARAERATLIDELGPQFPDHLAALVGLVEPIDGSVPPGSMPPGLDAELLVHDGHEPGHTAVWLPQSKTLLAGDMLSDVELPLPVLPDGVADYLVALDLLAGHVARAELLVPGHGTPTASPVPRLDADRRYLDAVLAGRPVEDRRLADPEMRAFHDQLVAAVAGSPSDRAAGDPR